MASRFLQSTLTVLALLPGVTAIAAGDNQIKYQSEFVENNEYGTSCLIALDNNQLALHIIIEKPPNPSIKYSDLEVRLLDQTGNAISITPGGTGQLVEYGHGYRPSADAYYTIELKAGQNPAFVDLKWGNFTHKFALANAAEPSLPPLGAIKQYGSITISDGSSYYTFSKDGSFHSGPMDSMSGRELDGRWTSDPAEQPGDSPMRFTVAARLTWINGLSGPDDYRRIVFAIYDVKKQPPEKNPKPAQYHPEQFFDGYFLIDEMQKIPKPENANSK